MLRACPCVLLKREVIMRAPDSTFTGKGRGRARISDRQLFFAALKGSRTAYRRLIARYAYLVQAEVCSILPQQVPYAKDLTRAVFKEAYRHLGRLRRPARFRGWVIALTRRVCAIVTARREQLGRGRGAGEVFRRGLIRLGETRSLVTDMILLPAACLRGKRAQAAAARFGRVRLARRIPLTPCAAGTFADVGAKLAKLPVRFRRVMYYHMVAGKSLEEISQLLHISRGSVSSRMLRCYQALGAVPGSVETGSFAALRELALVPAVALGEEWAGAGGREFPEVLRYLKIALLRYAKEAQLLRLTTREIEQLSFDLPGMILSPGSSYRWNIKPEVRRHRLFPVGISAVVHAGVLAILALAIVGLAGVRKGSPRLNVKLRHFREADELVEGSQEDIAAILQEMMQSSRREAQEERVVELTREEASMAMLIDALRKEPAPVPEGDLPARQKPEPDSPESMQTEELLEEFRKPLTLADRPATAPSWEQLSPSRGKGSGGSEKPGQQGGAPGAAGAGAGNLTQEQRERYLKWRQEAHRKLKEKIKKREVVTECFAFIKDMAYEKKSAFFSLGDARRYVLNDFLNEMARKVAKKCGLGKDKVLEMWENRKTHPKTVRLGISGTKLIEHRTTEWLNTHPVVRKRVIEYLIATNLCKVKRTYKEPCSTCGGKGYLLRTYLMGRTGVAGIRFCRVRCPVCGGLGYELVVVYK